VDILTILSDGGFSFFSLIALFFVVLVLSSYVKIVTVLGILRVGIGFDSVPSSLVTAGLAAILSFFVMQPVIERSTNEMSKAQIQAGDSGDAKEKILSAGLNEWKKFLILHTHELEIENFTQSASRIDQTDVVANASSNSWRTLAPAFIVSELKEAFATGLSLFLPFLVLDLFIATILLAVGYEDLNPHLVAFPFKLMLFVMVDGWSLITRNLVETYAS